MIAIRDWGFLYELITPANRCVRANLTAQIIQIKRAALFGAAQSYRGK